MQLDQLPDFANHPLVEKAAKGGGQVVQTAVDVALGTGAAATPLYLPHWAAATNIWLMALFAPIGLIVLGLRCLVLYSAWRRNEEARKRAEGRWRQ